MAFPILSRTDADVYVPDGGSADRALAALTHLAVAAHQDDVEFMALDGILQCFGREDRSFGAVVVTDGAGSPRSGLYAEYPDDRMKEVRRLEQRKAAVLGEYGLCVQLRHGSRAVRETDRAAVVRDLAGLLAEARPEILYVHNPCDKHDTHVAVLARTLEAARSLPDALRPRRMLGCEVWRGLDWMPDGDKVTADVSDHPNLAAALSGVFDSQVCGGKRYDLAMAGRRMANATFFASHGVDQATSLAYFMDLTPLLRDPDLSLSVYAAACIARFADEVGDRIRRMEME